MGRILLFLLAIIFVMVVIFVVLGLSIKVNSKTKQKVLSLSLLSIGLLIDIYVISLIVKLNRSSEICSLDPECMNESGMLYLIYYALLFVATIILLIGIIKTIRSYNNIDKK